MPLLTIITITYQAEAFIERTIQSLIRQTSQDFEYLVIDGGSKDNTVAIINQFRERINYLVSEPDKGLYDAMNKGLAAANGKYVWFMNAGDTLADDRLIEDILPLLHQNPDVIYGDAVFVNNQGIARGLRSEVTTHALPAHLTWKNMWLGMVVCHQSFLAKRSIAPKYMENNLSADIDWEIQILKKAQEIWLFPRPLSCYLEGGISNQQLKKSLLDRFLVLRTHFGLPITLMAHIIILVRGMIKIVTNKKKYW